MRKFLMITTLLIAALVVTNCGKKDKDNGEASADCFYKQTNQSIGNNVSGCNFNYSAYEGFENYSRTNYGYNNGFGTFYNYTDGCPTTHELAYSGDKGLGCVESVRLPFGQPVRYVLNASSGEFQPTYDNYTFNQTSVLWVCDEEDDCTDGSFCRGIDASVNQGIGICFR